jgi:hypothetical protein
MERDHLGNMCLGRTLIILKIIVKRILKNLNSRWVLLLDPREHLNEEGISSSAGQLFVSQAIAVYSMPVRSMTQVSVVHCVEPDRVT